MGENGECVAVPGERHMPPALTFVQEMYSSPHLYPDIQRGP